MDAVIYVLIIAMLNACMCVVIIMLCCGAFYDVTSPYY